MTAPQASADDRLRHSGTPIGYVPEVDYFLALLAERNVRFDAEISSVAALLTSSTDSIKALIESLRVLTDRRLDEIELRNKQCFAESDLRYQQRFEQQGTALEVARAATDRRLEEIELRHRQTFSQSDLRYQQRFDQQGAALQAAADAATAAVAAAIKSNEKAVAKSDAANEKRFDAVNELRTQLREQSTTFIPRHETEQRLALMSARIDELRSSDAQRSGRSAGSSALYGWIVGGIAAIATIVTIVSVLFK